MPYPGFVPVRQLVLVDLLSLIVAVRPGERAVVAIDGAAGAGKSSLARELRALATHVAGRELLSVSMDGFHHPRAYRYALGRTPQTYYRDTFDYDAFRERVLRPFRAGVEIAPASHDVATDQPIDPDPLEPAGDALLLVDGVFLHRPELVACWDASVFVEASAHRRDLEAHELYLEQSPAQQATWVLDNTNLTRPSVFFGAEIVPATCRE